MLLSSQSIQLLDSNNIGSFTSESSINLNNQQQQQQITLQRQFFEQLMKQQSSSLLNHSLYPMSSTSLTTRSADFFYAFNVLPISLKYLENKENFSFLTELGRNVDICELSSDNSSVHILFDDIFLQPNSLQNLMNIQPSDEKQSLLAQKLQAAAISQASQAHLSVNTPQVSFHQRAKKAIKSLFASKKDKRIFALAGSLQESSSRHTFSAHFSESMIQSLGFQPDQFMLKCSLTGFNEFFLRNDFITNMDSVISGILKHQSQFPSTSMEPVKIRQKFCKNSEEAMEAMFSVYLLPMESSSANNTTQESILVFEILHILDFQVSNKGKKFIAKKRSFDFHESSFLDRYLKSLNYQSNSSSADSFEDTSCESPLDSSNKSSHGGKRRKQISKQQKNPNNKRRKN